ncbi:hypothetical protein Salat_2518400 [Sesamum alatum]|uniref:Reverse transcriptase zinc-binding domain-containing protein n=1 Tax=Sesamum alatum TaxID=300844 RepID=A0AAE2CCB7_9LAMI|nr:hypothetical protein Salat_2518400 [Sesamum alatum]
MRMNAAEDAKLASLILEDRNSWNEELILIEFSERDGEEILRTPFGGATVEDRLVWQYENNGRFTVHSRYALVMRLNEVGGSLGDSLGTCSHPYAWKFLWKAQVTPKIQLFMWRACQEALLVNVNWRRRGVLTQPECIQCSQEVDILHALLFAPCPARYGH